MSTREALVAESRDGGNRYRSRAEDGPGGFAFESGRRHACLSGGRDKEATTIPR